MGNNIKTISIQIDQVSTWAGDFAVWVLSLSFCPPISPFSYCWHRVVRVYLCMPAKLTSHAGNARDVCKQFVQRWSNMGPSPVLSCCLAGRFWSWKRSWRLWATIWNLWKSVNKRYLTSAQTEFAGMLPRVYWPACVPQEKFYFILLRFVFFNFSFIKKKNFFNGLI